MPVVLAQKLSLRLRCFPVKVTAAALVVAAQSSKQVELAGVVRVELQRATLAQAAVGVRS